MSTLAPVTPLVLIAGPQSPLANLARAVARTIGAEAVHALDTRTAQRHLARLLPARGTPGAGPYELAVLLVDLRLPGQEAHALLADLRAFASPDQVPAALLAPEPLPTPETLRWERAGAQGVFTPHVPVTAFASRLQGLVFHGPEARQTPRVSVDLPALYRGHGGGLHEGRALDISVGGLFLTGDPLFDPGAPIAARLTLPGGSAPATSVDVQGVVRWRRANPLGGGQDAGPLFPAGMGVQLAPTPTAYARIHALVEHLVRRSFFHDEPPPLPAAALEAAAERAQLEPPPLPVAVAGSPEPPPLPRPEPAPKPAEHGEPWVRSKLGLTSPARPV